jgi:hypothetical protein
LKKKLFLFILFRRDYRLFGKYLGFSLAQPTLERLKAVGGREGGMLDI